MAPIIVKEGTDLKCPHCGEDMMAKVEDFVIPNKVGPASIPLKPSDCGDCDRLFTVEKLESGEYQVQPIRGHYDDIRER